MTDELGPRAVLTVRSSADAGLAVDGRTLVTDRLRRLAADWDLYDTLTDPEQRDCMQRAVLVELRVELTRLHGVDAVSGSAYGFTTAEVEEARVSDQCLICGEWKGPDGFEDGLRCKVCAEKQDAEGII